MGRFPRCMIWVCPSNKADGRADPNVAFFRKTPARHKSWMTALGRDPREYLSASNRLCSRHFSEKHIIIVAGRKELKDDAIPDIVPHFASNEHASLNIIGLDNGTATSPPRTKTYRKMLPRTTRGRGRIPRPSTPVDWSSSSSSPCSLRCSTCSSSDEETSFSSSKIQFPSAFPKMPPTLSIDNDKIKDKIVKEENIQLPGPIIVSEELPSSVPLPAKSFEYSPSVVKKTVPAPKALRVQGGKLQKQKEATSELCMKLKNLREKQKRLKRRVNTVASFIDELKKKTAMGT